MPASGSNDHTDQPLEWRIRRHAGLVDGEAAAPWVADAVRSTDPAQIEPALGAFLQDLAALNLELSGRAPSASTAAATDVPRAVAYAIELVINDLELAGLAERVMVVRSMWRSILAGDIDDLAAEAHLEAWATGSREAQPELSEDQGAIAAVRRGETAHFKPSDD